MDAVMTGPSKIDPGGVASYCNAVLPYLNLPEGHRTTYIELGSKNNLFGLLHPFADQIHFCRALSKLQPNLVHVNPSLNFKSFFRDGLLVFNAKRLKIPVVAFFHGWDDEFKSEINKRYFKFFKQTFLRADCFIVLASSFRDQLIEWGVKVPILVCTTAVPDDLVNGFSITDKIKDIKTSKKLKILYLSRLEKEKGIFETLEAVSILLTKGHKITLTIAGDGPAMREVNTWVSKREMIRNHIEIVGYVKGDSKKSLFRSHHIYCFPTYYGEGMPTSILEAMSFGMPVLTCKKGGISDFFEDRKMGRLLDSPQVSEVINSLQEMIVSRAELSSIAHYNFNYSRKCFRASDVALVLANLYENIGKKTL